MPSKPSALSVSTFSPFAGPSPTLAHINRVLSSVSGQDKIFMLYSYAAHVAIFLLKQKSSILNAKQRANVAMRLEKVRAFISDARVLFRIFGLFPILEWAQSLNSAATAPKDQVLRLIEQGQAWSMIAFYPMEAAYYLASKGAWSMKAKTSDFLGIWSCRFWAVYVVLQFAHNYRSRSLLAASAASTSAEKPSATAVTAKKNALTRDLLIQIGYLPLTVHWSLPNGLLPDNVWVGLCGSLAAIVGLKGVWLATA